jgi:protein subunit release factor A
MELNPSDIEISAWPKDPGGMRVYMPRGVKIKHKPTGVVVKVSALRSQHANRHVAMLGLEAILKELHR